MKRVIFCFLLVLGLFSLSFAQSGRRIKNPLPESSPATTRTDINTTEAQPKEEVTGYSESSTNQAVSIYVDRQNRRAKKDSKKAKPQPTPTPNTSTTDSTKSAEDDVLKISTELISIPVTVANKNGSYVPSLSRGNFQVFEDGKEQEVAYFGTKDKPFTAILLLDVSGSTEKKIEKIQDGAIAFVKQMFPQDKVMVIQFDSGVKTLLEFSSDQNALEAAIRKLKSGGGTSIYDAVDKSLDKYLAKIEGKKAIVLFTDGVDNSSRTTYEQTVSAAIESEAVIFPIYFNTELDAIGIGSSGGPMTTPPTIGIPGTVGGIGQVQGTKEEYALGRRYLQDLANATGGRFVRPDSSSNGVNLAFESVAEELRMQYEIGYYPGEEGKSGEVKKIKVRINRPNLIVRNRDSYVVK